MREELEKYIREECGDNTPITLEFSNTKEVRDLAIKVALGISTLKGVYGAEAWRRRFSDVPVEDDSIECWKECDTTYYYKEK